MKKIIAFLLLLLFCGSYTYAQNKTLKFGKDGKFKIVQFTDVHYIYGDSRSDIAIERMNEVLDNEKPDLVIFTGDVIYGKPAKEGYTKVMEQVYARNIPYAVTFGNHDDEFGMNRSELFALLKTLPMNLTDSAEGLHGVTNFVLPIYASDGSSEKRILYVFDTHSYSKMKGVKGYDYVRSDQIDWYKDHSKKMKEKHNNDTIPALAFIHIPFPEYKAASSDETVKLVGIRGENTYAPKLNSGLFVAMKEMGDVNGVFCGHDHDNDFLAFYCGIALAHGRYTGGNTVYNNLPNGARVIILTEGERSFDTYIVTKGGEKSSFVTVP